MGGVFEIEGDLENSGNSIRAEAFSVVKAGFGRKGLIQNKINEGVPKLSLEIEKYLRAKYGKEAERIWFEDGLLKVRFAQEQPSETPIEPTAP